jgi:hypothetical protein
MKKIALAVLLLLVLASCNSFDIPIVTTWYEPKDGGINCQEPCDRFATNEPVQEEDYGFAAACHPKWLGRTIVLNEIYSYECKDTGGSIGLEWNEYYGRLVFRVDILSHEEIHCNYCLYENWRFD